jgi:diguanylate cyclase (GGDEF)-like protein/PAS domain S-box-containing protein
MKLLSFLSTLSSVIYLYVGFNTFKLNKKSREGIIFLLLNVVLSIWAFTYSFVYIAEDKYTLSFWNKLSAVGWCFFPPIVLLLVLTITNNRILDKLFMKIVIPLPGLLFFFLSVFLFGPDLNTPELIVKFFYIGNAIFNYSYVFLSLAILYCWGKKSNKINQKKQARFIITTSIIPLSIDLITQTLLPVIFHISLPNITQILILIMLWGIYYAIVNYNFMLVSNSLIMNELFHEILDLTFLVDLEGTIIRTNKQVLSLLKYELADLINTQLTDIIDDFDLKKLIINYETIEDTVKLNHITIRTKDGNPIPISISVSPIRESRNQILLGILIVGQDLRMIEELKREISNHKKTAEKLTKSQELFRTVAETIPFSIILTNKSDNTILYINQKTEDLFNINHDDMLGKDAYQFYKNPSDRLLLMMDLANGKPVKDKEIFFRRKNNTVFSGLITMVTAVYNEKEVLLSCLADITEQKILQQNIVKSEEMLRKLMDSIPDLVLVCDIEGNITYINKSIQTILGYNPSEDLIPYNMLYLLDESDIDAAKYDMKRSLTEDIGPVEYKYIKKDGTYINAEVNGTILREKSSEPFGYVFVTRDITERKKVQEALKRSRDEIEKVNSELIKSNSLLQEQSIRDGLTNLYNHRFIMELLDQEISKSVRDNNRLCLMMLDIDYFKRVNDNFGHQTGDQVLNMVSGLIQINVRESDYVGRYGGEEFLVLLPDTGLEAAFEIAENIRRSVQDCDFTRNHLNITISIGLTEYRSDDTKVFMKRADTLLYKAKENGRNRIEVL